MPGPLHGVRVLELAHIILGPMACQMLADLGAEVIKVEAPSGDGLRTLGARSTHQNMASLFLACNRNKRSLVLDLKNKYARKLVLQLAEKADVVLHNNRPQVMTKLGLDYAAFRAVNPSIIYCGAYGYSTKGPYGERGAMDEALQAGTGISLLNKDANGVARSVPTAIADKTTALTAAYSILGALFHRARTGQGQELEVPMFETMVNYVMAEHQSGLAFTPAIGGPGYAPIIDPRHKPFATQDGWIALAPFVAGAWETFCDRAGLTDLQNDPRFRSPEDRARNLEAAISTVSPVIAGRSTQVWLDLFAGTAVPVAWVNSLEDLLEDPHLKAVGFWKTMAGTSEGTMRMPAMPITFADTPADIRRPPPRLGEHSFEVLRELGLSQAEIDALVAEGATLQADAR